MKKYQKLFVIALGCMEGLWAFSSQAEEPVVCLHPLTETKKKAVENLFRQKDPDARVQYKKAHHKTRFGEGMEGGPHYIYVRYNDVPLHKVIKEQDYESTKASLADRGISQIDEPEFVMQLKPESLGAFEGIMTWAGAQKYIEFFETSSGDRTVTLICDFEKLAEVNDLVPGLMVRKGYVKYFPSEKNHFSDELVPPRDSQLTVEINSVRKRPHLIERAKHWVQGRWSEVVN